MVSSKKNTLDEKSAFRQKLLEPIKLGTKQVYPIMLSPMAGITISPFRVLARSFLPKLADGTTPELIFVSDMINADMLYRAKKVSAKILYFAPQEQFRPIQIYGINPKAFYEATRRIVSENLADHIDVNFGCPVTKVIRRGGGGVLPYNKVLYSEILKAIIQGLQAELGQNYQKHFSLSIKLRLGIDANHQTFRYSTKLAADLGFDLITLHARDVKQYYSGQAHWEYITELKELLANSPTKVFGNGDIFCAQDAVNMVTKTHCDGVAIGRGCLGRPYLMAEIFNAMANNNVDSNGQTPSTSHNFECLKDVLHVAKQHVQMLVDYYGDERRAVVDFRKWIIWYLRGFNNSAVFRNQIFRVDNLNDMFALFGTLDPKTCLNPQIELNTKVRKGTEQQHLHMPHNYIEDYAYQWDSK